MPRSVRSRPPEISPARLPVLPDDRTAAYAAAPFAASGQPHNGSSRYATVDECPSRGCCNPARTRTRPAPRRMPRGMLSRSVPLSIDQHPEHHAPSHDQREHVHSEYENRPGRRRDVLFREFVARGFHAHALSHRTQPCLVAKKSRLLTPREMLKQFNHYNISAYPASKNPHLFISLVPLPLQGTGLGLRVYSAMFQ